MSVKNIGLAWITVKDLKKAIKFYTEVVGLVLSNVSEEFGWAELHGSEGGARLGICQEQDSAVAGQNAVMTYTVESLEKAIYAMQHKGARLVGEVVEVPGHVKMQTMVDEDNNQFQMVELLD